MAQSTTDQVSYADAVMNNSKAKQKADRLEFKLEGHSDGPEDKTWTVIHSVERSRSIGVEPLEITSAGPVAKKTPMVRFEDFPASGPLDELSTDFCKLTSAADNGCSCRAVSMCNIVWCFDEHSRQQLELNCFSM
ncbi:hypothetical protein EVAR_69675_1 [Eumeta japonica]|uniref:Uncharacterized protein n=1 Tax=Eumeta variegata TaxID=151549 RepID=A0A4C1SFS5_EUMVA|nr:hypothetical protein EVAR_69675_1 [Eumeta japonica]